jgi:hypothetical protein
MKRPVYNVGIRTENKASSSKLLCIYGLEIDT